jgi:hypothetical protein
MYRPEKETGHKTTSAQLQEFKIPGWEPDCHIIKKKMSACMHNYIALITTILIQNSHNFFRMNVIDKFRHTYPRYFMLFPQQRHRHQADHHVICKRFQCNVPERF